MWPDAPRRTPQRPVVPVRDLQDAGARRHRHLALRGCESLYSFLGQACAITVVLSAAFLGRALAQSPAPDPAEQKKILADATDYAFNHERSLPNFLCTQTTRRFEDFHGPHPQGNDEWRPI